VLISNGESYSSSFIKLCNHVFCCDIFLRNFQIFSSNLAKLSTYFYFIRTPKFWLRLEVSVNTIKIKIVLDFSFLDKKFRLSVFFICS